MDSILFKISSQDFNNQSLEIDEEGDNFEKFMAKLSECAPSECAVLEIAEMFAEMSPQDRLLACTHCPLEGDMTFPKFLADHAKGNRQAWLLFLNAAKEVMRGNREAQAKMCAITGRWEVTFPVCIVQSAQDSEVLCRLFEMISEFDHNIQKQVCSKLIGVVENLSYDARRQVLTAADRRGISFSVCAVQSMLSSGNLCRLFEIISEFDHGAKEQVFNEIFQECLFEYIPDDNVWDFIAENFAEFFPEKIGESLRASLSYLKPKNYGSISGRADFILETFDDK
ncbi:MAG: hypothetical protein LBB15_00350 [Puniceicoccales bacterium]|jgi:hypothetical protein|nr:hypothetical protein [Puniceicoccales bacterium]